jgi:hypothetical protein
MPLRAWIFISCGSSVLCKELPLRRDGEPLRGVLPGVYDL